MPPESESSHFREEIRGVFIVMLLISPGCVRKTVRADSSSEVSQTCLIDHYIINAENHLRGKNQWLTFSVKRVGISMYRIE